jgi:RES domain-containing protein
MRAVYTSATLSLAALELFVHTDPDLMPTDLRAISANIPDNSAIHELALSDLPASWRKFPPPVELQEFGRSWLVEGKAAILCVPSVVVPTERNYVLNPAHSGFGRIQIETPQEFSFDPRMWKWKARRPAQ